MSDPLTPRLAADSIVHRFGSRRVLESAYIDAVPGVVTALIGVSGSGKTTLLEILTGRRRPSGGQVRWEGRRVDRPSPAELARRGLVYAPDRGWLSTRLSIRRQLEVAARAHATAPLEPDPDLAPLLDRRSPSLSGGEQRLCELALARACGARVLVLDEPFRGLEPLHREALGRQLVALARGGAALLFADHDAQLVRQFADRVFALEAGRSRPVPEFRDRPIREWYHSWSHAPGPT